MKAGTVIKLPDGRVGTICYSNLDGEGGVWDRHDFSHIEQNINDDWPEPDFMLRKKGVEQLLRKHGHKQDMECVGEEWEKE